MNRILRNLGIVLPCVSAVVAYGHGIPIIVTVDAAKLTVSNGTADPLGYAPMIFVDDSSDAMMDHRRVAHHRLGLQRHHRSAIWRAPTAAT